MKKIHVIAALLAMLMPTALFGWNASYYAKVTVGLTTTSTGAGKIYAGNTENPSASSYFTETKSVTCQVDKSGMSGSAPASADVSIYLSAKAGYGFKFDGWYDNAGGTGTAKSSSADYSFTKSSSGKSESAAVDAGSYYAKFVENTFYAVNVVKPDVGLTSYTITGPTGFDGSGLSNGGELKAYADESYDFKCTVADGYEFVKWTVNGADAGTSTTLTKSFTAASTVQAVVNKLVTYYATCQAVPAGCSYKVGSTTVSSSEYQTSGYGTLTVNLSAPTAASGYMFAGWYEIVDGNKTIISTDASTTVTKKSDVTLGADFVAIGAPAILVKHSGTLEYDDIAQAIADFEPNDSLTLYQDATISSDVVIGAEGTLKIESGATLNIPSDVNLLVLGKLIVNGNIAGSGNVITSVKIVQTQETRTLPEIGATSGATQNKYYGKSYDVTKIVSKNGEVTGAANISCAKSKKALSVDSGESWNFFDTLPSYITCTVDTSLGINRGRVYLNQYSALLDACKAVKDTSSKIVVLLADGTADIGYSSKTDWGFSCIIDCAGFLAKLRGKQINNSALVTFLNGKATVEGSSASFTSGSGAFINCSSISINSPNANQPTYTSQIHLYDCTTAPGSQTYPANGGAFFYSGTYSMSFGTNYKVYGGKFSKDPTNYLASNDLEAPKEGNYWVVRVKKPTIYVAKVGSAQYESLQEAVNAASGGTVELLPGIATDDLASPVTVASGKTVTIDLAGYAITAPNGAIVNNGTLYLQDTSTFDVPGSITSASGNMIVNNGTMDVTYGKYSGNILLNSGTFTTHGGVFVGTISVASGADPKVVSNLRGGEFSQSMANFLRDGYSEVYCNPVTSEPKRYWVGQFPKPLVATSSLSGSEKAWRLDFLSSSDLTIYKKTTARSSHSSLADWQRRAELNSSIQPWSGYVLDCGLVFDRTVASGSVTFYGNAQITMSQSIDRDLAVNEDRGVLAHKIFESGYTPLSYGRYINEVGSITAGVKNNVNANVGTVCTMDLRVCTQNKNTPGEYDKLQAFVDIRYMLGGKKAAIDRGTSRLACDSLAEAVSAAQDGETVLIGADTSDSITVSTPRTFTIDPYGFNWTGNVNIDPAYFATIEESVSLATTGQDVPSANAKTYTISLKVAQVGDTFYANLTDAVAAANGAGVTLLAATDETITLTAEGQSFTLNKNGIAFDDAKVVTTIENGSVTVSAGESGTVYTAVTSIVDASDGHKYNSVAAAIAGVPGNDISVTITANDTETVTLPQGKTLTVTTAAGVTADLTVTPGDGAFIVESAVEGGTKYESKKITVTMAEPQATVTVTKIDHGAESEVTDTTEINAAIAKLESNHDVPRTDNTDKLDVLDKITVTPTKIVEEVVGEKTIIRSATFDVVSHLNAGQTLGEGQKLKFRLPVDAAATQSKAFVYHGEARFGAYTVQSENEEKFIEVESGEFSPYGYELLNAFSYNDFVEALYANNGSFNGSAAAYAGYDKDAEGRLVVLIEPAAGDWSAANCTAEWATPYRNNGGIAQLQLFHSMVDARKGKDTTGVTDVSVQNVTFVVAGAGTGSVTGGYNSFDLSSVDAYQLYLMNDGDVTFDNCGFDGVGLAVFPPEAYAAGNVAGGYTANDNSTIIKGCSFANIYDYAIKEVNTPNYYVTGTTFENCGCAMLVYPLDQGTAGMAAFVGNTFKNVDNGSPWSDKAAGGAGTVKFDVRNAGTTLIWGNNTVENCSGVADTEYHFRNVSGNVVTELKTATDDTHTISYVSGGVDFNTVALGMVSVNSDGTVSWAAPVAKIGSAYYPSLAAAVADATAGQTVEVLAGTFDAGSDTVVVDKAITITGAGKDTTTLNFTANGKAAISIQSNNVTIENMTINQADKTASNTTHIQIGSKSTVVENVTVQDVKFTGSKYSLSVYAKNLTVDSCDFVEPGSDAILLYTVQGTSVISDNTFVQTSPNGQGFIYGTTSDGTDPLSSGSLTISGNTATGGRCLYHCNNQDRFDTTTKMTLNIVGNLATDYNNKGIVFAGHESTPLGSIFNSITITNNTLFTSANRPAIQRDDTDTSTLAIDASGNYWGSASPDFDSEVSSGKYLIMPHTDSNNIVVDSYGTTYTPNSGSPGATVNNLLYKVTFVDEDGTTVLYETNVASGNAPVYGGTAPTKAATAENTFTWSGWTYGGNTYGTTDTLAPATSAQTYTATYSSAVNDYTVTVTIPANTTITVKQNGSAIQPDAGTDNQFTVPYGTELTVEYAASGAYIAGGTQSQTVTADSTKTVAAPADYTTSAAVAQIGTTYYPSLAAAVANASAGDTVELIADDRVSLTSGGEITVTKAITITGAVDANGDPLYTIYGASTAGEGYNMYNDLFIKCASGTVAVSNLLFRNFGDQVSSNSGSAPVFVSGNNESVILENLDIADFNQSGIYVNGGTFMITNCVINCSKTTETVYTKGIVVVNDATGSIVDTTITDCDYTGEGDWTVAAIECIGNGNISITGCEITSAINGIAIDTPGNYTAGSSAVMVSDCSVNADMYALFATGTGGGTLNVTSGTYIGLLSADDEGQLIISGGMFDDEVPEEYCADGYIPTGADPVTGLYTVKVGSYVAQNTTADVKYETLAEAVADADAGDTIKLLANVELDEAVDIAESITLDLDGKTVSISAANEDGFALSVSSGTVTITGNGTIDAGDDIALDVAGGTVTIANGTFGVVGVDDGSLTITGGTFNDGLLSADGTTTINGGTFNDTVKVDGGSVTINGGTFSSDDNVLVVTDSSGSITVNGGTFTATGDTDIVACAQDGGRIEIANGTFSGGSLYIGTAITDTDGTIAVSGGLFDEPVAEEFCATGYIPSPTTTEIGGVPYYTVKTGSYVAQIVTDGGATVHKFESLAAAVAAVPTDGTATTITMIGDETIEGNAGVTIAANQNVVLDLNGHTVELAVANANAQAYLIQNNGTLTVNDSGTGGRLYANGEGKGGNNAKCAIQNCGQLTVNGGTISAKSTNASGAASGAANAVHCPAPDANVSITINGGTLTAEGGASMMNIVTSSPVYIRWNSDSKNLAFTMTGGTLTGGGSEICSAVDVYLGNKTAIPASINISGGELNGTYAALRVRGGTSDYEGVHTTISGGTFTGFNEASQTHEWALDVRAGSLEVTGGTFNYGSYLGSHEVDISGGTFAEDVILYRASGTADADISGGTFGGEIIVGGTAGNVSIDEDSNLYAEGKFISGGNFAEPVPEELCADTYIPSPRDPETGYYTVKHGAYVARNVDTGVGYETLYSAVAAATAGDTVTLLTNVTESLTISKNLTLTGNWTLTGSTRFDAGAAVTISNLTFDANGVIYAMNIAGGSTVDLQNATVGGGQWCNIHLNNGTLTGSGVTMKGDQIVVAADGQTYTYRGETYQASDAPWGLDVTKVPGKTLNVPYMDIVREGDTDTITLSDSEQKQLTPAGSILFVSNMPEDETLTGVTLPARFSSYTLTLDADVQFFGGADKPVTGWAVGNWNEIIDTGAVVLQALNENPAEVPVELELNNDVDLGDGDSGFEFRYPNLTIDGNGNAVSGTIKYTDNAGIVSNVVLGTESTPIVLDMTGVTKPIEIGSSVVVSNVTVQMTAEQATAGTPVIIWDAEGGVDAPANEDGVAVALVDGEGNPTGDTADLIWDDEMGMAYIGPCEARLTGPTHGTPIYTTLTNAIAWAEQTGDTVTLLMNVSNVTGTITIDKSLTLDGGSNTVSAAAVPADGHRNMVDAFMGGTSMLKIEGEVTLRNITLDGDATHRYTYLVSADNSSAKLTTSNVRLLNGGELAGDANGAILEQGAGYGAGIHLNNGAQLVVSNGFYACTGGPDGGVFPFTGILPEGGASVSFELTENPNDPANVDIGSDLLLVGMVGVIPLDQVQGVLDYMKVPSRFIPYTLTLGDGSAYAFTGASPRTWNDIIDYGKEIMDVSTAIGYQGLDKSSTPVEVGLLTDTVLPDTFRFADTNFTVNGNGNALSGTIEYTDNAGLIEDIVLGTEDNPLVLDLTDVTQPIEIGSGISVSNVTIQMTAEQATAGTPVIIWDAAHGVDAPENEAGVSVVLVNDQGQPTSDTAELIWDDEMGMAYIGPAEARLTGPTHETPIYTTLANAIAWAEQTGDTVTLMTNIVNFTGTQTITKQDLVIDGAGYSITAAPVSTHRDVVNAWAGSTAMFKLETGDVTFRNITLDGDATHAYTFLISADNSSITLTTENVRLLNGGELCGDANGAIVEQGAGYGAAVHLNNGAHMVVSNGFYACTGGKTAGCFPFTGILVDTNGGDVKFELTGNPNDPENVDIGGDLLLVGMPGVIPLDQTQDMLDYMRVPTRFIPYTLTLGDGSAYAFTGASPLGWNDIIDYGKEIMDVSTAIGYQGLDKISTPVEVGLLTDTVLPDTFRFADTNFTVNGNGNALAGTIEYTDNAGQIHDIVMGTEGNALVLDMTDTTKPIVLGSGISVTNVTIEMTAEQATAGTPVIIWDAAHGVDAPANEAGVTVQIVDDQGESTGVTKELIWDDEMGLAYIGPVEARLTGPTHDKPIYTTLADAIARAEQSGDTVTLMTNIVDFAGSQMIVKDDLVLDGAGHTITAAPVTDYPDFFAAYGGDPMLKLGSGAITLKNITLDGGATHRYTYLVSADNDSVSLTTENITLLHGGAQSLDTDGNPTPGVGYGAAIHLNNGAELTVKDGFYADTHGAPAEAGQTIAKADGIFPFTAILPEGGSAVSFDLTEDTDANPTVSIGEDLLLVGMLGAIPHDQMQGILDYMKVPTRFIPYTLTIADGASYAFTGGSPRRWNDIIDYGKEIMDAATATGFDGLNKDTTPVEVGLLVDTILPAGAVGDGYDFLYEDSNFSINGNGNALSGTIKFTDDADGGLMEDITLGTQDNPLTLDLSETDKPVDLGDGVVIQDVVVLMTEDQATLGKVVFDWDVTDEYPPDDEQGVTVTVVDSSGEPTGEKKGLVWDEEYGVAYIGPVEARLTGTTHETPVYTSLANALDIAKDNDKVELLTNAVLSAVQGVGSDVTLDLAGYKVSVNGEKGLFVTNATLVIADTSVKTNGTICAGDEASPASLIESGNGGVVNIPTGIFAAASGQNVLVTSDNGAFAVSGGYFSNPVLPEHCAPGYAPIEAPAGAPQQYTVGETVPEFRYPIDGTAGVPVTNTWLATYMSDIYDDPTKPIFANITNDLVQALSVDGANGIPRWESYVLGLDPTDPKAQLRLTATSKDAATVTITGLIDMTKFPEIENVAVTFRLAEQNSDKWTDVDGCTGSDVPSFTRPLEGVADKVLRIFADIEVR